MFFFKNKNVILVSLLSSCMLVMWLEAACYSNEEQKNIIVNYALVGYQGRRHTMEDFCSANQQNEYVLFAVYDGHGGSDVAKVLAEGYYQKITSLSQDIFDGLEASDGKNVKDVLSNAFVQKDKIFKNYATQGSTALVALLNMARKKMYLAWVGDSRGIVVDEAGKIILETKDHKPNDDSELQRIKNAGGTVMSRHGMHRVNGYLGMSRAFGDFILKPYTDRSNPITAEPDIVTLNLNNKKSKYLVLASDGVWDVCNNEKLVNYIHAKETLSEVSVLSLAKEICDKAFILGSKDNIMAIVVDLTKM